MFNSNDFRREIENLKAYKKNHETEYERLVNLANIDETKHGDVDGDLLNLIHYYKVAIVDAEEAIKHLDTLVTLYYWQEDFNSTLPYIPPCFSK